MSGTSVDGVDFVLVRASRKASGPRVEYVDQASVKFPAPLREKILRAASHHLKVDELAELHFELGRFYSKKLQEIAQKKIWKFDLIGLHGQTVYHRGKAASLQIGESSFLSALFQVPVIADFRSGDVALGGQGAPLAPYFHRVALGTESGTFAIHNLGGISNLTLIKDGKIIRAFDTGPANMPIDLTVQTLSQGKKNFDAGGRLARKGRVDEKFVELGLSHPYLKKKAPKSCGREEFGEIWLRGLLKKFKKLKASNLVASITEVVAVSIAQAYQSQLPAAPTEIILCGGGAKNDFLRERLQKLIPGSRLLVTEQRGWPAQAVEGAAFALLAAARVWEIPVDLTASTGAERPALLGKITDV